LSRQKLSPIFKTQLTDIVYDDLKAGHKYHGLVTHTLTTFYKCEALKYVPGDTKFQEHGRVVSEMMADKTS